jgi:hypothetical protein
MPVISFDSRLERSFPEKGEETKAEDKFEIRIGLIRGGNATPIFSV